jgi:hypothetical protein
VYERSMRGTLGGLGVNCKGYWNNPVRFDVNSLSAVFLFFIFKLL